MPDIKQLIDQEKDAASTIRQALHRIPERGFTETKTSAFIEERLKAIPGMSVTAGIAGTGVLGILEGTSPGKTLLIRADMDALPVHEETGLPFASTHENMMHACGHDGNMTMALLAAAVLAKLRDRFSGTVKFMFQPAEEGPGGAKPMIEAGIMENPTVDYAVAGHLWPDLPAGTFGLKPGILMSSASFFEIEISGKGGHGAMPHKCIDALDTACQVVNGLQRVVSRKLNPITPSVLTVGSFHSGAAHNTIPDKAVLTGTTRTFDRKVWQDYPMIMEPVIKGICDAMGASYSFCFDPGYPPLENDPDVADRLRKSMLQVVPEDRIHAPDSTMGGEDMSFVFEKAKGCYFFLGTGFEGCRPLHNARFDFDESVLLLGAETFVRFAMDVLG